MNVCDKARRVLGGFPVARPEQARLGLQDLGAILDQGVLRASRGLRRAQEHKDPQELEVTRETQVHGVKQGHKDLQGLEVTQETQVHGVKQDK